VGVTPPSAWPWLDHSVSGLLPATERPVQTRFRCAFAYRLKLAANGNSLTHYTKGTPSHQKVLRLLVGIRFQVSFTPLSGCFSPFPHGTCSLSVTREYLGLGGGPPGFTRNFTGSVLLGKSLRSRKGFAYGTVTRYGQTFQTVPLPRHFITPRQGGSPGQAVPQPPPRNARRLSHVTGLASSAFAHHYSRNRGCFLFLPVLRCFTSRRYLHPPYVFRRG
jgi:hypothetical protein